MSTPDNTLGPIQEENEPKPDAIKQPVFEPKRVIHLSKPPAQSDDGNRKPASFFGRRPASRPATANRPEEHPFVKPETPSRNVKTKGFPMQGEQPITRNIEKSNQPDLRLRTLVNAGREVPPPEPPFEPPLKSKTRSRPLSRGERTRRAYWDITTAFSLIVNAILVAVLLIMARQINNLKTPVNGLLSGLYGNFVEMDKASITTTITVDTQVPINFMLPIQQNTEVMLTSDVTIPNAYVVINSGGLSISAAARVTLPAGTNLPIALNLSVPVLATVPVTLQVPVNIPLSQTELHRPFTGLQDTLRPLYCLLDKNAQYPQGYYICTNHDTATSTPGTP